MKLRVNIKNLCKAEVAASTLDVIVAPEDTVLTLKERVAVAAPVSLAEQEVLLNNVALGDSQRLSDCGVKDMDSLVLRFKATEHGFAKQLAGLLTGNAVAPEELALLYTHKYGITARQALEELDRADEKLQDFLGRQKGFALDGGRVRLAEPEVKAKLATVREEAPVRAAALLNLLVSVVVRIAGRPDAELDEVEVALGAARTVAEAKTHIARDALVPFPDCDLVAQGSPLREQARLADCGLQDGARLVLLVRASEEALVHQLKTILLARIVLSPDQLATQYCLRYGVPFSQALKTLGLRGNARAFLEARETFAVEGGCVRLAKSRSATFERVAAFLNEATAFLNVHSIAEGGLDAEAPEAVLTLNGLPPAAKAAWLPGLLRSVGAGLEAGLGSLSAKRGGVVGAHVTDDAVQVLLEGGAVLNLRLAAA